MEVLLGVISPKIYGRKDQLFETNAFKGVISSGIHGRRDQKFEANSSKDVISSESPCKEKSNI